MRTFRFSLYRSKTDRECRPVEGTWPWMVKNLFAFANFEVRGVPEMVHASKEILDEAKDGPAIVLAAIEARRSHRAENVIAVHAIAIDIDGRTVDEIGAALDPLANYAFAAYTTFKHGADVAGGLARLRVIVPFAEPIDPKVYPEVWARMNALVGGINDPATKDISRLHFLPATFDASLAYAWDNEGAFISVEELPLVISTSALEPSDLAIAEELAAARKRIKSARNDSTLDPQLAAGLTALSKQDSLAEPGARHETLRKITWWLSKKHRALSDEALEALFATSITVMQHEDPSWDGLSDVLRLYHDAVVKRAAKASSGLEPYSPEELQQVASVVGCEPHELNRRWIIMYGQQFFFLQEDGNYSKPYIGKDSGRVAAAQYLARAPVLLNEPTENGVRKRSIVELVEEYGWHVERVAADMTIDGSYFNPEKNTLYEAIYPIRVREPVYNPAIARWLELLAGDQIETLLDWLALFPDLTKIEQALYMKGSPGGGKSLLAHGLARFWTEGAPTSFESILGSFNERIATCPLIFADEHVPNQRGFDTTAVLRQLIGKKEHELTRKHVSTANLHGSVRVILAANNADLLRGNHILGPEDQAAMFDRFFVIETTSEPQRYLDSLGGFDALDPVWRAADAIAKHCLWLTATRAVDTYGKRFGTKGKVSAAARQMFMPKIGQSVTEWLIRYLANPNLANTNPGMRGLVRAGDGEFLVNGDAITMGWQLYLGPLVRDEPRGKTIGEILSLMKLRNGNDDGRVQRRVSEGRKVNYYRIDPTYLTEYSRANMIGDPEEIMDAIRRPILKVAGEQA